MENGTLNSQYSQLEYKHLTSIDQQRYASNVFNPQKMILQTIELVPTFKSKLRSNNPSPKLTQ